MFGCSYTHKYVMSHCDKFAIIRTFDISAIYLFMSGRKNRVRARRSHHNRRIISSRPRNMLHGAPNESRSCACRSRVAGCLRATVGWKCPFRLTRELYQHPTWLVRTRYNKFRGILQSILTTTLIYIEANSTVWWDNIRRTIRDNDRLIK